SDPLDADHSLDLPQSFLSRGAVAYLANSGYGWGLRHGIGYGERLVQLFTDEMSRGGTVRVGEAVLAAKQRYFLEAPRFDPYDEKSLMQWTLFGLPMYAVDTGIESGSNRGEPVPFLGAAKNRKHLLPVETFGPMKVQRQLDVGSARRGTHKTLPAYLTRLQLHFDLTAPGVYKKYNAAGDLLAPGEPGCPDPAAGEPEGCYYTLNDLAERGTGVADRAIQPYFIYDSRLSGTSQHGVLWMGGEYDEDSDWVPVFAELVSNGGDGSDHGVAPRMRHSMPNGPRIVPGEDPPDCRPSDLEINSLVVTTGEVLKPQPGDPIYSVQRLYRELDLEVLYFNNTSDSSENCDRMGPQFEPGPFGGDYHQVSATTVEWAVPATDEAATDEAATDEAGVWRVVVVYDDGTVDSEGRGRWQPLELMDDGGIWRGSVSVPGPPLRLTYILQAVDRRGNVSWLEYRTTEPEQPASGVPLDLPETTDVDIALGSSDLSLTVSDTPDPVQTDSLLAYTVLVQNQGPDAASSVSATDTLPAGVSFTLASGGGWSCDESGGVVTCDRDF
ncbi:MAG: DUF11 domain-containing protein, partial [bacterium]|nr:DUF11 domain-containing protein [bacterium]